MSKVGVAVTRILRNGKPSNWKPKLDKPDAYDLCIKAKAIARSSGAEPALSFALNQLPSPSMKSSRPVLINTVLSALSKEGKDERFWAVVESKVDGNKRNWSPQLAATLLNQISREMEQLILLSASKGKEPQPDESSSSSPSSSSFSSKMTDLMQKSTQIYVEALETVHNPEHLHIHNAYLKCISRHQNVPLLMWILNLMTHGKFSDINLNLFGVREYVPVSELSLKVAKTLNNLRKPVALDAQSLTSILATLSRSQDGSIQLAESIWSKFKSSSPSIVSDKLAILSLLLVYRNDLSRILRHRKLIRSLSWRERKHARVLELITAMGVDLVDDPKLLSIYFEICLNAKLSEKIGQFLAENRVETRDERLLELIRKSKKGN